MAEKTLILKVDLSCTLCCNKMKKIFCKYQDKWNIKKITWDEKNDKIVLVGPFDPEKLQKKLCCKACRTIQEFIIPPPTKPAPKPAPEAPKPAPEPPKHEKPAPEPPKPEKPAPEPPKPDKPAPEPPKPDKPAPEPPKPEKPAPDPPKPEKPAAPPPAPPSQLLVTGEICICGSCHDKKAPCSCDCTHSQRPCCCCGDGYYCGYGHGCGYPPPPMYGRPTCQLFWEDDTPSTCSVM